MYRTYFLLLMGMLAFSPGAVDAQELGSQATITVAPEQIIQGDPLFVSITSKSQPLSLTFDGKSVPIFLYQGTTRALVPIDIRERVGTHAISVKFTNGETLEKIVVVYEREKIEEPLGIPAKLGGNTKAAQTNLVSNLSRENALLANLRTGTHAFWKEPFRAPLASLVVTDSYGYSRKTGDYTIAHKGTDFRASLGTEVFAMNRGVVRVARTLTVYGKTIVVDHGFGLQTLYLHLSKMYVNEGELVLPGQVIGLSGMTGYAEVPHLHLSIKINGVSVDPMRFLEFFSVK